MSEICFVDELDFSAMNSRSRRFRKAKLGGEIFPTSQGSREKYEGRNEKNFRFRFCNSHERIWCCRLDAHTSSKFRFPKSRLYRTSLTPKSSIMGPCPVFQTEKRWFRLHTQTTSEDPKSVRAFSNLPIAPDADRPPTIQVLPLSAAQPLPHSCPREPVHPSVSTSPPTRPPRLKYPARPRPTPPTSPRRTPASRPPSPLPFPPGAARSSPSS